MPVKQPTARGSSILNTFLNRCFAVDVARLAGAMIGSRPHGLERDVRLAILSIGKTAATNLPGLVGCVPAFLDASPIGFRFLNVTWNQVFHDDFHRASPARRAADVCASSL